MLGLPTSYGQVGDGNASQSSKLAPVAVAGSHTFTSISAGAEHTCGIDTAGAAWCWGWDEYGQLGDGNDYKPSAYDPMAVLGGHSFSTLAPGQYHTCGVDTAGKGWCWGWDGNGQLGDGSDDQATKHAPVAIADDHTFARLTAGTNNTCGIDTAGKAWCWGWDGEGGVGDGDDGQASEYAPVAVADNHTFTTVTAGTSHTCGIASTGSAWCWGLDTSGQVGDGNASTDQQVLPRGGVRRPHLRHHLLTTRPPTPST